MPTSDGITAAAGSDGISSCLTGRPLLPRLDHGQPRTLAGVGGETATLPATQFKMLSLISRVTVFQAYLPCYAGVH